LQNIKLCLYIKSFINVFSLLFSFFKRHHESKYLLFTRKMHIRLYCTQKIHLKLSIIKYKVAFGCCTYPLRPYISFPGNFLFASFLNKSDYSITQRKYYMKSKVWQIIATVTYITSAEWLRFLSKQLISCKIMCT